MNEAVTDALLRQFLLGKVTDEERQQIETLFLTDAAVKERVLALEEELIDDYLEESLTTEDKEQFFLRYAQTPEQQRKLRIAQSIKEWAVAEKSQPQSVRVEVTQGSSTARSRMRPALIVPLALAAVVLIVAALWLWSVNERQNRRLAVEQQLAQLNSPSHSIEDPAQILSLDLSPVTVRSAEQSAEIKPQPNLRVVELRLPWIQKEQYSTYQAEIGRVGDDASFTIRNLQPVAERGYAIRLRVPVEMLQRGQYQVRLNGVAGEALSVPEEYLFSVSN